jgi:hypothetical protein
MYHNIFKYVVFDQVWTVIGQRVGKIELLDGPLIQ